MAAREALARHADAHPQIAKRAVDPDKAAELLDGAQPLTAQSAELLGAVAQTLKAQAKKVVPQKDLPVISCLLHYKAVREVKQQQQASKRRGKVVKKPRTVLKDALRTVMEVWGNPMVSELDETLQDAYIEQQRAAGVADWTILTRLKCIWAAIRYVARKQYLLAASIPVRTPANKWDPPAHLPNRHCKLTEDELARLFDEAWKMEHTWRYMISEVGEAARPLAPCEVTPENVDWETGNLDLLEPEAEGVQSKKGKATIRCAPTLFAHLKVWRAQVKPPNHDPHFITYQGKCLKSMHFFRELCARAGVTVSKKAGAYVLRHTLGTWMARCRVPEEQRKYIMGQRIASGSHGFYMQFEPGYLLEACNAIELLYHVIAARMKNREAARALLILGTEPVNLPPSEKAAAEVGERARGYLQRSEVQLEEQPQPQAVHDAWARLEALGLWIGRRVAPCVAALGFFLSQLRELAAGTTTLTRSVEASEIINLVTRTLFS